MRLQSIVVLGLALLAMPEAAQASYTLTLTQTHDGVLAVGTGEVDTDLLTYNGSTPSVAYVWGHEGAFSFASVIPGTGYFGSFSGSGVFGTGPVHYTGDSQGDELIFDRTRGYVAVPRQYVSGTQLNSQSLFAKATFDSLGLTAGTYTYTYSESGASDHITVQVGVVPLPSAAPLFGAALLALAAAGTAARRKRASATA